MNWVLRYWWRTFQAMEIADPKALDMWLKSGLSKLDSECPQPSTKGENGREETREDVTGQIKETIGRFWAAGMTWFDSLYNFHISCHQELTELIVGGKYRRKTLVRSYCSSLERWGWPELAVTVGRHGKWLDSSRLFCFQLQCLELNSSYVSHWPVLLITPLPIFSVSVNEDSILSVVFFKYP